MTLSEIIPAKDPLILATPDEVMATESRLWISFPTNYREYVTRLGEGALGSFIRIYPPWRIECDLQTWRHRIEKYWFWDDGRELLPKERAVECIIIGDTLNGDELVFHPTRPDHIFVLPHDDEMIYEAGKDLLSAIEWAFSSGKLVEPFKDRNFEPFDSRERGPASKSSIDPEGETLDDIIKLGREWAKRHVARSTAENRLVEHVGSNRKAELLYEAIFLSDGLNFMHPGYSVAWRITDKKSGEECGTFEFQLDDGSQSHGFKPASRR